MLRDTTAAEIGDIKKGIVHSGDTDRQSRGAVPDRWSVACLCRSPC